MAVLRNMWLRGGRQTLGGVVLYTLKGATIARELAAQVSNPRTDAQMEQRVKLANLVAFYRASRSWMRGAFENKKRNQSDYNAFVSWNSIINKVYLTKQEVEVGTGVVAPYRISNGSMGMVTLKIEGEFLSSNLYIGDMTFDDSLTVAQFTRALMENNNNLREGIQLSLIQYIQTTASANKYEITCRPYEVVLSLSNAEPLGRYLPIGLLLDSGGEDSVLQIDASDFVGGCAIVLSESTSNTLRVSTADVVLTPNNNVYARFTTEAQRSTAIRSYGENSLSFLDSRDANFANAEVAIEQQILSVVIGGRTYRPGDVVPYSYAANQEISVLFAQQFTTGPGASLRLTVDELHEDVIAPATATTTQGASLATFKLSSAKAFTLSPNRQTLILFECEAPSGQTIAAVFYLPKEDDSGQEGLE